MRAMPDLRRRRAGTHRRAGRARGNYLGRRIGGGLKECRLALRLTQLEVGERAGISQGYWSFIERGGGAVASLETLAACAAAVDAELAAFLQAVPGADLPRDVEHLRRQQLVIAGAKLGGWTARPERPIDPLARRSRSIDVELERADRREIAVVEVIDLLADGGDAMRGLADKVAAVRRDLGDPWTVSGLLVLRSTTRNRRTVRELDDLFATRFPASSAGWMRALHDRTKAMPAGDGLVWSSADGSRLFANRSV